MQLVSALQPPTPTHHARVLVLVQLADCLLAGAHASEDTRRVNERGSEKGGGGTEVP